jgi:coenzyme F420-0:L-glutamate ligase / coenzyme F420-1:gamma-L-glutamate ligase
MNESFVHMSGRDVFDVIENRRSIRRYRADPVPQAILDRLLRAAAAAPSAHNRQPWRYVLLADEATRERLATAMGRRLAADRQRDGDDPEAIRRDVERSYRRISGAPLVVVICLTVEEMDKYDDARRSEAEFLMAVQSVAMAAQNLLLAAYAEGLGACWLCAPLFCPDTVASTLELPRDWLPQGLLTLGFPLGPAKFKDRKPVSDILLVRRSGQ